MTSSKSMSTGSLTRARAIATRCCWPPDSWSGTAVARSLGLSTGQTLRHVVLPQGIRRVVPALLNDFVSLQKDSGLVSIIGAADAVANAGIYTARTFNFTSYVVAGLLFVALTIPMTRLTDRVARRRGQVPMGGHL